ncbi:MAG: hypothetical protein L3J44_03580, partial [Campylobacteraceae bacterium]|nr:hypothetical protein [Campylobacteraceae bacterium]
MKYDSNRLVKLLMTLSVVGFIILAFVLTFVFTNAFYKNFDDFSSNLQKIFNKNAKIEAEDKIAKITNFINIYKKTLEKNAKQNIKDNVNFAMDIVAKVYRKNAFLPKD